MIPVGILTAAATSSFSFLLDLYPGATIAYSLRKLRSTYTGNSIRVRRSSDNTETNIGFVNNLLDTATLSSFCGSGNGFVTTWYDQSLNGNNALQILTGSQPQIVLNGVIFTQNGLPTLFFLGISTSNDLPFTGIVADTNISTYIVGRAFFRNGSVAGPMFGHFENGPGIIIGQNVDGSFVIISKLNGNVNIAQTSANSLDTNFYIQNVYITTDIKTYKNNTLIPLSSQSSTTVPQLLVNTIGKYGNILTTHGYISEAIIYKTNQLTNQTGINANINSFYTIF
jgi:hypothetical protein